MEPLSEELQQLMVDRAWKLPKQFDQQLETDDQNDFSSLLDPGLGFEYPPSSAPGYSLGVADFTDSDVSETGSEPSACSTGGARKRKTCSQGCGVHKRTKPDFPELFGEWDCLFPVEDDFEWPNLSLEDLASPDCGGQNSGAENSEPCSFDQGYQRARSVESTDDTSAFKSGIESECDHMAEYHFQQIQQHAQLAIAALRRGQYERSKNIVTWAHDLKNKVVHELKKEAETAWGTDKDQERCSVPKPAPRKHVLAPTKRVEQFRKNMRRWMIGTQTGVEWMVYARMEHLQAIAKFILGDALPADPASPTAIAESIINHLQQQLPAEFIDSQLAEPEPGKRYVIGPGLVPLLQAKRPRKTQTLAFTMPANGDEAALDQWLSELKALFPKKPVPKAKASKA